MPAMILYFTKGLRNVVAGQLGRLLSEPLITESTDRFIVVQITEGGIEEVLNGLRTVDDVRLVVAASRELQSRVDFVAMIEEAINSTPKELRDHARINGSSVTLSTRRPFWEDQGWGPTPITDALIPPPGASATRRYTVDFRIQVDGRTAHVSVSAWSEALSKKSNSVIKRPGALRASVAAAMIVVAQQTIPMVSAERLYDPCCGSGTILLEAMHSGAIALGSDIDPGAVDLARAQVSPLMLPSDRDQLAHRIFVHDITKGWPKRVNARVMVSNIPWGKQITIERHQPLLDGLAQLIDQTLARDGVSVILTQDQARLSSKVKRKHPTALVNVVQLGFLGQSPWLMVIAAASRTPCVL